VRLQSWIDDAADFLYRTLALRLHRRLHVVSFLTNEEARRVLDRPIPATMALAPYAGDRACLIVVQSPTASPENAIPNRMRGILVHEIAHQHVAERTGSEKLLGDRNRSMNVSAWLNEGLAELLRWRFLEDAARIAAAEAAFRRANGSLTWSELSDRLEDLDDGRRGEAFTRAAGATAWLARPAGIRRLFDRLPDVDRIVPTHEPCARETLAGALRLLVS